MNIHMYKCVYKILDNIHLPLSWQRNEVFVEEQS